MSRKLDLRLREDRALRDAARSLLTSDIVHLRANLAGKGFGKRIVDRMSNGAADVFEDAVEIADNNRGVLTTLVGAVLLWFARNPIMALFTDDDDEADVEPDDSELD